MPMLSNLPTFMATVIPVIRTKVPIRPDIRLSVGIVLRICTVFARLFTADENITSAIAPLIIPFVSLLKVLDTPTRAPISPVMTNAEFDNVLGSTLDILYSDPAKMATAIDIATIATETAIICFTPTSPVSLVSAIIEPVSSANKDAIAPIVGRTRSTLINERTSIEPARMAIETAISLNVLDLIFVCNDFILPVNESNIVLILPAAALRLAPIP